MEIGVAYPGSHSTKLYATGTIIMSERKELDSVVVNIHQVAGLPGTGLQFISPCVLGGVLFLSRTIAALLRQIERSYKLKKTSATDCISLRRLHQKHLS